MSEECKHDWRGGWECRCCGAEDRRGPTSIAFAIAEARSQAFEEAAKIAVSLPFLTEELEVADRVAAAIREKAKT